MNIEPIAQVASEVLGLFDDKGAQVLGAGISLALGAWQARNAERFATRVRYELSHLDQRKLDRAFVRSDDFKEFVLRVVQNASETASGEKHTAFARLLANTAAGSLEAFKDKHLLRRLLDQVSDSEMLALTKIHEAETEWKLPNKSFESYYCTDQVAQRLNWSPNDARMATEGLHQLQLLMDVDGVNLGEHEEPHWISEIGNRLIAACQPISKTSSSAVPE